MPAIPKAHYLGGPVHNPSPINPDPLGLSEWQAFGIAGTHQKHMPSEMISVFVFAYVRCQI